MTQKVLDDMWAKYDTNNNGFLDKEEGFKLILDTMADLGDTGKQDPEHMEEAFKSFDTDNSGQIARLEMAHFIKKLME